MMESQKDMKVPEELFPVCPHCEKPMTMNLRSDGLCRMRAGIWRRGDYQRETESQDRTGLSQMQCQIRIDGSCLYLQCSEKADGVRRITTPEAI